MTNLQVKAIGDLCSVSLSLSLYVYTYIYIWIYCSLFSFAHCRWLTRRYVQLVYTRMAQIHNNSIARHVQSRSICQCSRLSSICLIGVYLQSFATRCACSTSVYDCSTNATHTCSYLQWACTHMRIMQWFAYVATPLAAPG